MSRIWINTLPLLAIMLLGGCATSADKLLTRGDATMMDIWQNETGRPTGGPNSGPSASGQAARQLLDARQLLRRPLTQADIQALTDLNMSYTRTAQNEIYSQFKRLPNPDLVMYVFPHLAGTDPVPVPGYSTVFPLHQRVQYALPSERVEGY